MISVNEAKSLIQEQVVPMPLHLMPLALAAGATLGADVYAKTDIPAFEQSSMTVMPSVLTSVRSL